MQNNKGQVTIFIILGILITGVIVGLFMITSKNSGPDSSIPVEVKPVYNFVQNCLKETGENALIKIGEQGGYFLIFDEPSVNERIPYYFIDNKKFVPTQKEIELNLAGFVSEEFGFCILNFKDFRNNFDITSELNKNEVKISDEYVTFSINYPLAISKDGNSYFFDSFSVSIPVRIGIINKASEEIIAEHSLHPDSVCLSCLYKTGQDHNVQIDMLDYGNSTIFNVIDDKSKINNESYSWSFAVK